VEVLRLGAEEHVVLLTMHHIISDGWSMGVLVKEVGQLYEAYSQAGSAGGPAGVTSPLAELAVQYADYAVWQREYLQGAELERQLSYWREQLAGAPPVLELPTDRPRPALQSYRGASIAFVVDEELCAQIEDLTRRQGVTTFMTLFAAFQTLLFRYTGQADIVVGTPVAGRTRGETEDLIGFFINTLALRTRLSGDLTFHELLKQVHQVCLDGYAHQDMPFEKVVEELAPERRMSHTPLFQIMFALQNVPPQRHTLNGNGELKFSPLKVAGGTAKFDLTLVMVQAGRSINASLEYSTDLFDAPTIEVMIKHFQRLLWSIVSEPEKRLKDLRLLSDEENCLLGKPLEIEELNQSFSF
jgi:hypothetical protein